MSGIDKGHLTLDQLRKYIRNELSSSEREHADQELLACEGCMWRFMEAMEEAERGAMPIVPDDRLPDMERLEERVMAELLSGSTVEAGPEYRPAISAALPSQAQDEAIAKAGSEQPAPSVQRIQLERQAVRQQREPKRRGSWLQSPVAHYTIAASITLLLVATGALSGFSEKLQVLEEGEGDSSKPPYSISAEWRHEPAWSDRLVHQASSLLDGLQALRFK
jgi:hypothetical protein